MKVSQLIEILSKMPQHHVVDVASMDMCCTPVISAENMEDDCGTVMLTIGDPMLMDDDGENVGTISELIKKAGS